MFPQLQSISCRRSLLFPVTTGTALLLTLALAGCSGGGTASTGSTSSTSSNAPTPTTAVQINMGDAPSDWMLAFSMNITFMTLTGSTGSTTVLSSSTPMEMMHLMGAMQPLAMIAAPQGTYTGAAITMGSATALYMDPTTKTLMQKTIAGPINGTVTFSTPITVGATPMAMSFDLDLAHSVTMDSSGNLSMSPVFKVTSGMQGAGNGADPANGGIQQMMGMVSTVSSTSFTMTSMQAAKTFTFSTNSSTKFVGGSMGSMASGMLALVDAALQSDGSLMATRVQSMMSAGGVMGGGIITALTGQPPTSLTMVMQNGAGSSMMSSYLAAGGTINLTASATYAIDQDDVDLSGLPFTPTFDSNHIYVGQNVMPVSANPMTSGGMGGGMMGAGMMGGTINASQLLLMPQGLTGANAAMVSANATTSFTLALPAGCAFTTLTGATSVVVFQQTDTVIAGSAPIAGGSSMHVFGLLFFDGGQWKMVASRMGAN